MCIYGIFGIILGFIVSKEEKTFDLKKIKALVKMLVPKNLRIFKFSMAQFYRCFIKKITYVMVPITKLLKKIEMFEWTSKWQTAWEDVKNRYIQPPTLIIPN
jgi:hypothetical protein